MSLLTVENLTVAIGGRKILRGVNFTVERGEILVVVGESGSGKSTLLKAIDGLLTGATVGGKIFFDGRDITHQKPAGSAIGMIFQNAAASFCPVRTIGAQIFEAVRAHRDWDEKFFRARAAELMAKINLDVATLDEYPFRLSGGMAQRAGILAATILQPKLLLADEPTSALDALTAAGVVNELLNLRLSQNLSIVLVTHDEHLARRLADKILTLEKSA